MIQMPGYLKNVIPLKRKHKYMFDYSPTHWMDRGLGALFIGLGVKLATSDRL